MSGVCRVTREELSEGLRALGLGAGDGVMVHSSLSSFGRVAGGPESVIHGLMDVLTGRGTLLLPSFNHFAPWREGGAGCYDPAETPTTNGVIPETFRKMPGIRRSLNPTHPIAAWGRDAESYTRNHHLTLTMGPDSPLGRLWRDGGYCLFLGTNYHTNTFKHVVETTVGSPCLGHRTEELPARLPAGREVKLRTWSFRERKCPIMEPNEYAEREMDRRGLHRRGRIGESTVTLFRYSDCFDVLSGMLAEGYAGFPPCAECPIRPSEGPHTVESDWDEELGCLKPDSPSRQLGPMAYRVPG
jgi:aminoglycoside N3'-acetyltransferase